MSGETKNHSSEIGASTAQTRDCRHEPRTGCYKRCPFWLWITKRSETNSAQIDTIPGGPIKPEQSIQSIFRTLLWSTVIFFTLLDRASFPHYNNTKIIKFGWKLFILWVISYGLSFSGFARFPVFRGTIKYMRQHMCWRHHSTSYKETSVPMTCLDCKSLLGNRRITEHNTRSIYGRPELSLIVPRNSGNRANPENDSP